MVLNNMQLDEIKITMLGTTGAGKTSYLLGMYAVMQTGIQGFTLAAKDMDLDLELTQRWEKLISLKGEDRWPTPNAAAMEYYGLEFSYGFRPLMGFQWLDYRGLALSDRSTEQDVADLVVYLQESACLFLCISGEYLTSELTPKTVREIKSDRMNQFIQQYVSNNKQPNPQQPFPVAIVITKYDLCHHREREEIIADVKKLFQALFTPNSGWLVMICPVSLGRDLGEDPDNARIVPVNVHLPLVFAVYSQLRTYGLKLKSDRDRQVLEVDAARQKNALWQVIRANQLKEQTTQLETTKTEIMTVEENMKLLCQELQQVSLYFNGSEVTADV
jgi:GTPase SAR1 family protein